MNKSALKKFATSMRLSLMGSVKNKIEFLLSDRYKDNLALYNQNKVSIEKIRERYAKDKTDFIEEVAYTWFNRFIALRFMDVNEITPSYTISTTQEQPIPQIFIDAKGGNIDDDLPLDKTKFFDLIDKKISGIQDPDNEAYKLLFIATCNYYSKVMPFMFEAIADYTELLLPDDMLSPSSLRNRVVESMVKEDCQDVEVIGWLYQFYIAEKKDDVFAKLKKNQKITPSNIPAATQLFTPHWIVKYMVENSLGKLWLLNNPTSSLKDHMKYYIENEEETNNDFIKVESPEELTFLDPCCGSGHTLTYAFDLLTLIYEEQGYTKSEIPSLILENNLFGCDIDKRASVLANFALTMKARQYHKRFFRKSFTPNIIELQEFGDEFKGIKNYGSLMKPSDLEEFEDGIFSQTNREFDLQKKILGSEFHCLVTNPPYMGGKGMNKELSDFVKNRYPDSKADLFAVFMERGFDLVKDDGYMAMITMQSWMFLSSYEKMRDKLLSNYSIATMAHLDNMVMGIAFGTSATVFNKKRSDNSKGIYFKVNLDDLDSSREIKGLVELHKDNGFVKPENRYTAEQLDFKKIPGEYIAYWLSNQVVSLFDRKKFIGDELITREGMATADNDRFLKYWTEVEIHNIAFSIKNNQEALETGLKWFPYNKGGEYRKWFGNNDYIVDWSKDGYDIKNNKDKSTGRIRSHNYNGEYGFKEGMTWAALSSSNISVRYSPVGFLFDSKGAMGFSQENIKYYIALVNSNIGMKFLEILAPTMDFKVGDIIKIPFLKESVDHIIKLVNNNINISKEEWDSRETSWDFVKNELIKRKSNTKIESAFENYCTYWKEKFYQLHSNEEELNRLFIEIYELQNELTPDVDLKDITILKQEADIVDGELVFNADEIMKQLISYAVGVMFGRYSLDQDGLVVANLGQEYPTNTTFEIDDDNVIPVLDDEYFSDDIVARFINFVKITFGEESLSENIKFIEESLGKDLRKYFVKDFYPDHIKRYKKRPIYWMVSSPKKGFMSLIYMHRYTPDVFGRVRNSYLTEYIAKLEAHKETLTLTTQSSTASNKDKKDADKQIKNIDTKLKEIIAFDRDVMMSYAQDGIEIDLDDGVKVNYCKFKDILYEFDKKLCE